MKNWKKASAHLRRWTTLTAMVGVMIVTGCSGGNPGAAVISPTPERHTPPVHAGATDGVAGYSQVNNPTVDIRNNHPPVGKGEYAGYYYGHSSQLTPDRLTTVAQSVDGVDHAVALIYGQRAIIGIIQHHPTSASRLDQIVTEIRHRILVMTPEFSSIHVATDFDTVKRIRTIVDEIRAGRPLTTLTKPIEQLLRVVPAAKPAKTS